MDLLSASPRSPLLRNDDDDDGGGDDERLILFLMEFGLE